MFFIVGVGRSGTSLLQSILSSHSKISLPPETGYIRSNILSWNKAKKIKKAEVESDNEKLARFLPEVIDHLPSNFNDEGKFYQLLLQSYKEKQEKELVGDKDPRLIESIYAVLELFPDSKFIHLVRDPRDVLLSKKKAEWSKDKPSWYHIFANYVQLKLGEKQGKKLTREKYMFTTYEDILSKPQMTISNVCEFLNVEFEESMLSFQDKAKELVAEDEKQWKKETMGPLLKNNTGKWKGKLKPWEVALTERLCQQTFKIGNYESSNSFSKLTFMQKFKVSLFSLFLKGLGSIYIPYRLWSQKLLIAWKY